MTSDDRTATVEAEFDVASSSQLDLALLNPETHFVRFELRSAGGEWRVDSWRRIDEEAAKRLADLDSTARAGAFHRLDPRLITIRFVRRLHDAVFKRVLLGDLTGAQELFVIEREAAWRSADPRSEVLAVATETMLLRVQSPPDAARGIALGDAAIASAEKLGDPDLLAEALVRRARANQPREELPSLFQRALDLAPFLEDTTTVILAAGELGSLASFDDNHRKSMKYALQAEELARHSDDPVAHYLAGQFLGYAYYYQSEYELAAQQYEKSLDIARRHSFKKLEPALHGGLASCYAAMGDSERVLHHVEEGLVAARTLYPEIIPRLLAQRGGVYLACGELALAEADYFDSIIAIRATKWWTNDSGINGLIDLRIAQKRYDEALELAESQYQLPSQYEGRENRWAAFRMSLALRHLGQPARARELMVDITKSLEAGSGEIFGTPVVRQKYRDSLNTIYLELMSANVELGLTREAVAAAERVQSAALFETLDEKRGQIPVSGSIRAAEAHVSELNARLLRSQGAAATRIQTELAQARSHLDDLLARSASSLAPMAGLPARAEADEPIGSTVVKYILYDDRLTTFVVAPGRVPVVRQVPVNVRELNDTIARYVGRIDRRALGLSATGRKLYDLLFAPIEHEIAGENVIHLVPYGALWRVPFQALVDRQGRYVADTRTISYAPSIAALRRLQSRRPDGSGTTLLAIGDPRLNVDTATDLRAIYRDESIGSLPDAATEVESLGAIYGPSRSEVLVGSAATETSFKQAATKSSIIHVATHGVSNEKAPLFSSLLLSASEEDDGFLEAREIAGMSLNASLAVLSACNTGRGRVLGAEGIVGLSWAFLAAGCPNTVVSQWRAESKSTSLLMVEFHKRLKNGATPADALRAAQLELRKDPRYRHPFYWAPFIVVGRN